MAALIEGQYELDGYLFGAGTPVAVLQDGDVTEAVEVRDQDIDRPAGDGVLFGRDYLTAPGREFIVMIEAPDAAAEFARLRAAHRADSVRAKPLAVSTLRWRRDGRTYRAYGRGRSFLPLLKGRPVASVRFAQFQFRYRDALTFDDDPQTIELGLVAASLSSGFTLPRTLPWVLGTIDGQRAGVVTVDGDADVPFTAVINGPTVGVASKLRLAGPGWLLDFGSLTLAPGQTITVDTSAVGSALRGGVSVAGYLSRTSTLTGRVRPGASEFVFSASDPSATASAVVSWRPAALTI